MDGATLPSGIANRATPRTLVFLDQLGCLSTGFWSSSATYRHCILERSFSRKKWK